MQKKDLIVLVADKDIHSAIDGVLSRNEALGLRQFSYDLYPHLHRDPGCLLEAHSFLLPFRDNYKYSIVVFDHHGCGQESKSRQELETQVENLLALNGWDNRSMALVLEPEIETWIWSDSPHVSTTLGWRTNDSSLNDWLVNKKYLAEGQVKPQMPKEALKEILRVTKKPRSSSIFLQLAQTVSFQRCIDPSFLKLKSTLQSWLSKE